MEDFSFDINELIVNTIEEYIGIPCFFMRCEEDLTSPYVIFSIINETETDRFDNKNLYETYNVDVTLWYTDSKDYILYKEIKQALKTKGFKFKKAYDLIDESGSDTSGVNTYYGKLLNFNYKNLLYK